VTAPGHLPFVYRRYNRHSTGACHTHCSTAEKKARVQMKYVRLVMRYVYLMLGLFVVATGMSLTLEAKLGLASWTVLQQAVATRTGLSYGHATQGVGLVVVLASMLLGIWPSLATLLNMYFVGYFVDLIRSFAVWPAHPSLVTRLVFLFGGVLVQGFGVGMYVSADLGAGPRDNLMLGIVRRTHWRVRNVRTSIELGVLILGWALGGPIGIGTLALAFLIGPSVELALRLFRKFESWPIVREVVHVPASARAGLPREHGAAG